MTDDLYHCEYLSTEEDAEETAVWRRDPISSFSDWTIKVLQSDADGTNETDGSCVATNDEALPSCAIPNDAHRSAVGSESVYHVHKVFLASGPRKSEYFQTLFSLTTDTQESLSETTTLVLPESACWAFPRFLDFVYGTGNGGAQRASLLYGEDNDRDEQEEEEEEEDVYSSLITNGSGSTSVDDNDVDSLGSELVYSEKECRYEVALAFLADYLRVPALVVHCQERLPKLLHKNNVHVFCREAQLVYSIDWIVEACINVAAESPKDLLLPSDPLAGLARNNAYHTPSLYDAKERSSLLVPGALETFLVLPHEKQIQLLRRALSATLCELETIQQPEEDAYLYDFKA